MDVIEAVLCIVSVATVTVASTYFDELATAAPVSDRLNRQRLGGLHGLDLGAGGTDSNQLFSQPMLLILLTFIQCLFSAKLILSTCNIGVDTNKFD